MTPQQARWYKRWQLMKGIFFSATGAAAIARAMAKDDGALVILGLIVVAVGIVNIVHWKILEESP